MTDLHTHILPGIDDGARTVQISLNLLQSEQRQGVAQIALTPHFNIEKQSVKEFLHGRNAAARQLGAAFRNSSLSQHLKLGAEIFYSSELATIDLRPLCLTGTNLLLIEFPPAYYPREAEDVLYQLTRRGFVPLIAHVERYAFVRENPNILCDLIEAGAYTQVNATSLVLHKRHQKLILQMIRHGMIHVLATDTHSLEKRPPKYRAALDLITKKCGTDAARALTRNANLLFAGASPMVGEPEMMRHFLFPGNKEDF